MSIKSKSKVTPLIFKTYLSVIQNSLGTKLFRNFYAIINNKKKDIMRNGELSCAFYVSSILALFKMIKRVHGTVDSTVKDLRALGWQVTKKLRVGSVIVWQKRDFGNGDIHKHIGFYIGNKKAVSNSYKLGYPVRHHWTFRTKRSVEAVLWNPKLFK